MNSKITESGYGYISQEVMRDKGLSRNAKAVYAYLCGFAGKDGACYPSRELMSDELDVSKQTLTLYIRELTDRNYVSLCNDGRDEGRFTRDKFIITHLHSDEGAENEENNAESADELRGNKELSYTAEDKPQTEIDSSEYRAYHKSGESDGACADRFPFNNDTAIHGSAVYGSAVHGSAVHGSAVHGQDGRGINNNIINKNNNIKNTIFKNNTFKNNSPKKNRRRRNRRIKSDHDIDEYLSVMPEGRLRNSLGAYIDMRREMHKPLMYTSLKELVKRLGTYSSDENVQADILDRSVLNSWVGVYPEDKKEEHSAKSPRPVQQEKSNVFVKLIDEGTFDEDFF